jgi:quinol monooxygenase YgiN
MIVVTGHITLSPDHRDTALAAIAELVPATRAEPGNLEYRYSVDLDDENRINIEERWEDEDAMTAHMGAEPLATFMGAIGPCIGGSVSITRYDVSGSTTIF